MTDTTDMTNTAEKPRKRIRGLGQSLSLIPKQEYLKKYSGKNGLSIDADADADAADSGFNSKIRSIR